MSLYPDVREKAQTELHTVVGPNRLPDHADRSDLPYISAIIKECLRWQNPTPLGIAHAALKDDEYEGYFIPAGTIVIANTWCVHGTYQHSTSHPPDSTRGVFRALLHDHEAYPEPERFHPERFLKDGQLDPQVRDPALIAFGYGRRYVLRSRISPHRRLAACLPVQ